MYLCIQIFLYVHVCIYIYELSHDESKTIWGNTKKGFHTHVEEYLEERGECIKYICDQDDNESCGFFCIYIALQYLKYKTFDIPKEYIKGQFKTLCWCALGNIEDSKKKFLKEKVSSYSFTFTHIYMYIQT